MAPIRWIAAAVGLLSVSPFAGLVLGAPSVVRRSSPGVGDWFEAHVPQLFSDSDTEDVEEEDVTNPGRPSRYRFEDHGVSSSAEGGEEQYHEGLDLTSRRGSSSHEGERHRSSSSSSHDDSEEDKEEDSEDLNTTNPRAPSRYRAANHAGLSRHRHGSQGWKAAETGAVVTESAVCSRIGTDVLEDGGNAADAIVASVICVGVTSPWHSGIAGGGVALVRDQKGGYQYVDFRDRAPAKVTEEMYMRDERGTRRGGSASTVPGELRGLKYIHETYGSGKFTWAQVLAPAIKLARDGFAVTEDEVRYLTYGRFDKDLFTRDRSWMVEYTRSDGHGGRRLIELGDTHTRRHYADVLEEIAEKGPDALYRGALAQRIVDHVQRTGGVMTLQDLEDYRIVLRKPLSISYHGYKITAPGAPTSGAVLLNVLKVVEQYEGLGSDDPADVNLTTHRLVEAMKFAYAERTKLGDPSVVPHVAQLEKMMLSEETARQTRSRILDDRTLDKESYSSHGPEKLPESGTAYMGAADQSGLSISLTTTINELWGSHEIVQETGIVMNNGMDDFSLPFHSNLYGIKASQANSIRGHKRALSSATPVIVEAADGRVVMLAGAAGGPRIITATLQILHNVLDRGLGLLAAVAAPRMHHQLAPDVLMFEYSYSNFTTRAMRRLGHRVEWRGPSMSSAQAIRVLRNGTFEAVGEPRQKDSGGFAV